MFKNILLTTMLVAFSAAYSIGAHANVKIGYVNLEAAVLKTKAGKKIEKSLKSFQKQKQAEITKMEKSLESEKNSLDKKMALLSPEAKQQKMRSFQEKMLKYRELVGSSQVALKKKEAELTSPILKKMEKVVDKMAKDGGYTMILRSQQIIWGANGNDLTDELTKAYNKAK